MAGNKRIKIQIERKGFIDLFEDINIPITKLLADIRDLSKRSGGYSTSIEVPGSKNNLQLFGHLYDINITNSTFSLNKKYKCVVIKDDIEIFEGFIRMEGINKYEGPDNNTLITFNISLHDDVANFYMKIKDKFINPLENVDTTNNIFWDDLVISKYNYSGITATFANTVDDKFKFFLPYQNRGYYQTTDFKPCVFAYEYVNRIVSSAGYTWNGSKDSTGNFIDKTNWDILNYHTNFDKLVIPYAGSNEIQKTLTQFDVYAGYDGVKYSAASATTAFIFGSASTSNAISVLGQTTNWDAGDIIKVESTITFYLEIKQFVSTSGGTYDYYVNICDSNGVIEKDQTSLGLIIDVGKFTIYWPTKYSLKFDNFPTFGTLPTYDARYRNQLNLSYNLTSGIYHDNFNQLLVSGITKNASIVTQSYSGSGITQPSITTNSFPVTADLNYPLTYYVAKSNGDAQVNINQLYDLYFSSDRDAWFSNLVGPGNVRFDFFLKVYKNNVELTAYKQTIASTDYIIATSNSSDPNYFRINKGNTFFVVNGLLQTNSVIPVVKGDNLRFEIDVEVAYDRTSIDSFFNDVTCTGSTCAASVNAIFQPKAVSTIDIKMKGNIQEDDENLSLVNFIPKKVKQSDLLLGLCKVFNLFIDYDEKKKSLLILPRDQYYELGTKIDWSQKLDISNKNNFQFYPDLKYKNYIYTYKLDSDGYSKAYNDNVKEIYGQANIKFENDLLDGTTTIDSIFYSTPIARAGGNANIYSGDCSNPLTTGSTLAIPRAGGNLISIIDYTKTTNLKLLYDCGLIGDAKSTPFVFRIQTANALPSGYTYQFTCQTSADLSTSTPAYNIGWIKYSNLDTRGYYLYPHIGHFYNGPMQPNDDLNYAQCDYYFYNDINIFTQNNLFYKHFLRTIRQQRDCKLLKARIHLSPAEVNSIKFNNQFYLFETWWVLNKFEYNEDGSDLYNVELINVI